MVKTQSLSRRPTAAQRAWGLWAGDWFSTQAPERDNFFYAHFKMADTFRDRLLTNKTTLWLAYIALRLAQIALWLA